MENITKLFVLILSAVLFIGALSRPFWAYDPPEATRVLQQQGFKDIKINGYAWFACAEKDFWQTEFEATALNGTHVKGAVCRGAIFKANTVRLY